MTSVTVRDPFSDMRSIMRRSFDEPFFARHRRGGRGHLARHQHQEPNPLALDVYETEEGLTIEAPIPGFSKDEVEVVLEKGKLTIRAETTSEAAETKDDAEASQDDGRTYFIRERHWGSVSRSLFVGDSWDADSVSGTLNDGVLVVTIKKAKEAQPRRVEIA